MVIAVLVVNPTTRLSLNANEYLRSKPRLNQESPVSPRAPRRVQPPRHLAGGPSGEARRLESKVQSRKSKVRPAAAPFGLPRRIRGFPSRWDQEAQSWLKTNGFPGMLAA
jgi:hypothetical protein